MKKLLPLALLVCSGVVSWAASRRAVVSIYAHRLTGRLTASGQRYDPRKHTAANKVLPFGTCVRLYTSRVFTYVTINDRGPWVHGRVFDVSEAAARDLKMHGLKLVKYQIVPHNLCESY